ncbi:MAG TPA: glycosyltransferase family 2 protein [Acidimicrobiales bacterium]|nr:glycosyltransferase family 2 protein [Acidimicrobiales bacterium]
MISVIIPAHNEEQLIGRCLDALLRSGPSPIEIIVVCNGCQDRTAEVARSYGRPVSVIETSEPGKAQALNLGDRAAQGFPRVFLDADIELEGSALNELIAALGQPGVLAATVERQLDLSGCSWVVRSHYRARSRCAYPDHLVGRGVYALSELGRSRFGAFPPLLGDDLFVQRLFRPEECATVTGHRVTVRPPVTARDLVRVKTRVAAGNLEQRRLDRPGHGTAPGWGLVRANLWPPHLVDLAVYVTTAGLARFRARAQLRAGGGRWETARP